MKSLAKAFLVLLILGSALLVAQQQKYKNRVNIVVKGNYRYIYANGIPVHRTGRFPNRNNPNAIRQQRHAFRVPVDPKAAREVTKLRLSPFGVGLNGVPFDPGAAEFWNRNRNSGWQYEALGGKIDLGLDFNNAHVQPGGSYHYHGSPTGLISRLVAKLSGVDKKENKMVHLGYAADGFPVYSQFGYTDSSDAGSGTKKVRSSYRVKQGNRPNGPKGRYDGTFVEDYEYVPRSGDLDECNGRTGVTPEYPDGIYHYYITKDFPFIPRNLRGTLDESFLRRGPGPGGPRGKRPPPFKKRPPRRR